MGKLKVIKNRVYTEWKNAFNHNVEQIERAQNENKMSHKATNKRIDNLVLSSGGDSPNEVTDARTDASGTIHDTLKARIDSGETLTSEEIKDVDETLENQSTRISSLENTINELYNGEGSTVDIYVSEEKGNDTTGDGTEENPFKTIQEAANSIPFLSPANYYIHVEPGVYQEDVIIVGIIASTLEIVATNNEVTEPDEDTGVFVRSIFFNNCQSYCAARGITQIDPQNSLGYFISFDRTSYGVANNCRAVLNTKNLNTNNFRYGRYRAFNYASTVGNLYKINAYNQYNALSSTYGSSVRASNDVKGEGNIVAYNVEGAFFYVGSQTSVTGDTEKTISFGGQVFGL